MVCKLKARVNLHGVLNVEQGYYVEDQEVEEPIPEKEGEKKDADVSSPTSGSLSSQVAPRAPSPPSKKRSSDRLSTSPRRCESANMKRTRVSVEDVGDVEFGMPDVPRDGFSLGLRSQGVNDTSDVQLTSALQAMDTGDGEKPKMRKVKKQVRKGELPLSAGTASLDQESKAAASEKEMAMIMEDKLVADTEDKKNELESFI